MNTALDGSSKYRKVKKELDIMDIEHYKSGSFSY